jgi:hypothetical protein
MLENKLNWVTLITRKLLYNELALKKFRNNVTISSSSSSSSSFFFFFNLTNQNRSFLLDVMQNAKPKQYSFKWKEKKSTYIWNKNIFGTKWILMNENKF